MIRRTARVGRQGSRRLAGALVASLLIGAACLVFGAGIADATDRLRLAQRGPTGNEPGRFIDGTQRRILRPALASIGLPLNGAPPHPVLVFSIGIEPPKPEAPIGFEVFLRADNGETTKLLSTELIEPGWYDQRIDLAAYDLTDKRVIFTKTATKPTAESALGRAVWGDPAVVSGKAIDVQRGVILISLDTLRADRVGVYGYAKAKTPSLDALARQGAWYEHAYSLSTWTYPSHAATLFGIHPISLPRKLPDGRPNPAAEGRKTLAELLRDAGFATAGFTGGGFMSQKWGFSAGFDTYFMFQQPPPTPDRCAPDRFDGAKVFDLAQRWLRDRGNGPFFLFVHTYEVHDRCPVQPAGIGPFVQWPNPGPAGVEKVSDYYDSLIARTDGLVGGLMRTLDELGLTDTTLVMVMSDHGDGFWEHGFGGHGCPYKPYEEITRVPLILRYPKVVGKRGEIEQPVSLLDLAPTALDLMNVPAGAWMQGKPLPGLGLAGASTPDTPLMIGCDDMLAVRVGDRKLITSGKKAFPDEVYDLSKDPGERTQLKDAAALEQLRKQAAVYWGLGSGQAESEHSLDQLDEKTKERLRALGYIQ